jgi:hypothetical protein
VGVVVNIGIDLGQKRDPSAIAVAELDLRGPKEEDHWVIRHLERLPLGTPYPEVAERLGTIITRARAAATRPTDKYGPGFHVYADATGVGQPVVDILKAAGQQVTPVYFTFGDKRTAENGTVTLGKGWLVSRLQALLQTRRLHLPRTTEAEALAEELLDYEIKVDPDGDAKFGAFRVGQHDDLVTALGLAVQAKPAVWGAY